MIVLAATPVRDLAVDGPHLCGLTWMDGLLWFSDGRRHEISAIDPETGAEVTRIACPGVATGLTAVDGGPHLLQVVGADKQIRELDARTGDVVATHRNPRPQDELCGLQHTPDGLWMGYKRPAVLDRRRWPQLELSAVVDVNENVADVTVIGSLVAFANHPDARINIVDPLSGEIVSRIAVEGSPTGLTWDGAHLWYCDYDGRRLRAIAVPERALTRAP